MAFQNTTTAPSPLESTLIATPADRDISGHCDASESQGHPISMPTASHPSFDQLSHTPPTHSEDGSAVAIDLSTLEEIDLEDWRSDKPLVLATFEEEAHQVERSLSEATMRIANLQRGDDCSIRNPDIVIAAEHALRTTHGRLSFLLDQNSRLASTDNIGSQTMLFRIQHCKGLVRSYQALSRGVLELNDAHRQALATRMRNCIREYDGELAVQLKGMDLGQGLPQSLWGDGSLSVVWPHVSHIHIRLRQLAATATDLGKQRDGLLGLADCQPQPLHCRYLTLECGAQPDSQDASAERMQTRTRNRYVAAFLSMSLFGSAVAAVGLLMG